MSIYANEKGAGRAGVIGQMEDPPIAQALFKDVRWSWIWIPFRLYAGWQWLDAGYGKATNPAWVGAKAGTALSGFVKGALSKTAGEHPDVQSWYASFLQNVVLPNAPTWSYLVTAGEILVGQHTPFSAANFVIGCPASLPTSALILRK